MYNFDYIPIDQEVIDQAVKESQKKRNESKEFLRNEIKNTGGNFDIIAFRNARKDFNKFKRIVRALEDLRIFWCEIDGEILTNRHELYDAVLPKE